MQKTLSRKITIYVDGKPVEGSLAQIAKKIKELKKEQEKLPIGTQEYIEKSKELSRLQTVFKEQKDAIKDLDASWQNARDSAATYSNILMGAQSAGQMLKIGSAVNSLGNSLPPDAETAAIRFPIVHLAQARVEIQCLGYVAVCNVSPDEGAALEVGAVENSVFKTGAVEVSPGEVGTREVGTGEILTREVGAAQVAV